MAEHEHEAAAEAPAGDEQHEQQQEQEQRAPAAAEEAADDGQRAAADGALKRSREEQEQEQEQQQQQEEPARKQRRAAAEAAAAAGDCDAEEGGEPATGDDPQQLQQHPGQVDGANEGCSTLDHANPGPRRDAGGAPDVQHAQLDQGPVAHNPVARNPGHGPAGVPLLREGLELVQNEDGTVTETLAVSKQLVGKLIGKGGATISQLQAATGTNVQVDQEGAVEGFADAKRVTVRGMPESVAAAKAHIAALLSDALAPAEGETEEVLPCPASLVGRVIGRGGETIRSLQQASGAHILVDQNFPEGVDRMISVKGTPDGVQRAANMIRELIAGEPGSASGIIAKYGIGESLSMPCPKLAVGRIIGKGGETIKALQRRYGVSIQIDQSADPMTVVITGPQQHAVACQAEVATLIADPGPHFGQGMGFAGRPAFGAFGPYGAAPYGAYGYAPAFGAGYGAAPGYAAYGPAAFAAGAGAFGGAGFGPAAFGATGYGQQQMQAAAQLQLQQQQQLQQQLQLQQQQQQQQQDTGAGAGEGSSGAARGYGAPAAEAPAGAGPLWQAMQDDQGRTYYYNTTTGVSQWEKPADMA